ncbi:MAG: hypothetical protein D6714_10460 [Bacteroidetes bacterium]|nr:MAG: hypothetical protein D6714_10460 [Bacteroidota bacterium]
MRISYRVLFLALPLLWSGCQEDTIQPDVFGSLFGEVLTEDNVAIEGATISTNPPTSIVFTDDLGRFALENIKTGTYSIRAEKAGYIPEIQSITVFENQTATVEIKMSPDSETNNPPNAPEVIAPPDGSVNQPVNLTLKWSATDPDEGDELTFDVYLFNPDLSLNTVLVSDMPEDSIQLNDLKYSTTYYWQVVVRDGVAAPVNGPVWHFTTESFPDHRFLFAKKENGKYDIYSANIAFNAFKLTQMPGSNWRPLMSPDRAKIAFISNVGIEAQLFVMNRDGSDVQQVTSGVSVAGFNNFELDYAWSPNSTQLLYMHLHKLYRINLDGSGLQLVAQAPPNYTFSECDWTPVNNQIVARVTGINPYDSKILLYDQNGNLLKEVMPDLPGSTGGAVFSIDGKYILYTYDVSQFESPDGRQLDARIFLYNLTTDVTTDLSVNKPAGTNDLDPRFSPDGAKVIFMNTNNDGISPRNIWVMNLQGDGRTLLFEDAEMPDWR